MLSCLWKKHLGVECPGCGLQRSFLKLFEGEFSESFFLFPATIPLLVLLVFLILHLIFRFRHGASIILGLFSLSALLMIVNFIYKFCIK